MSDTRYSAGIKLKILFITPITMSSIVFLISGLNASDTGFQFSFKNAFVFSSANLKEKEIYRLTLQ